MSGKLTRRGFVALAGGLLLGGALAGTAVAQQSTEAPWGPGTCPMGFGGGPRAGRGPGAGGGPNFGPGAGRGPGAGPAAGLQGTTHDAIATALGMSSDELFTAMRSGKTVAQLAQEKGVELEAVVKAALEAHDKALDAQVQAGRLSQEQADLMDSRMEAKIRAMIAGQYGPGSGGGPGSGPGMGPGRRGPGMGNGFGPGWRGQQ
jgi:hypothetical protein